MPGEVSRESRALQVRVQGSRNASGALGHRGCLSTQLLWPNYSHLGSKFNQTEAQKRTISFQFRVAYLNFALSVQCMFILWN